MITYEGFAPSILGQLFNAALFASDDKSRPLINSVHLRNDGDSLIAISTDTYRLARIRIGNSWEGLGDDGLTIDVNCLNALKKIYAGSIKKRKDNSGKIITLRYFEGVLDFVDNESGEKEIFDLVAGVYPANSLSLFPSLPYAISCHAPISFNPVFLASMTKVVAPKQWADRDSAFLKIALLHCNDPLKPAVFEITEPELRLLVMPVRV